MQVEDRSDEYVARSISAPAWANLLLALVLGSWRISKPHPVKAGTKVYDGEGVR